MRLTLGVALLIACCIALYLRLHGRTIKKSPKVGPEGEAPDSSWNYKIGLPVIRPENEHETRVLFRIAPASPSRAGSRAWLATYSSSGHTARFTIEIDLSDRSERHGTLMHFGRGRILSSGDSDSRSLLPALAAALDGHVPRDIQRRSEFSFDYVHFGDNLSEIPGGGFQFQPAGGWTAMKLFLNGTSPEDSATVYFSFDPVAGEAQFSNSNSDYGDDVLRFLSPVL